MSILSEPWSCLPIGLIGSPPGNCPQVEAVAAARRGTQRRRHLWDWATPKAYLHDEIATDKRNPTVNANGLIYGSPEDSTDLCRSSTPCVIKRRR